MIVTLWKIWSIEHNAWWRPDRWGYTKDFHEAGEYTTDEAIGILADTNIHLNRGDVEPNEAMIPSKMIVEFPGGQREVASVQKVA